ncbi:DNA replication protein DnaC [Anaerovirgula multivorans]|uniref:DNA replication protein DnaC n=1 Tax=Anaerovirgula multivorans TaxID=312168 RepID=A0A239CS31_9FIRM|nr:ATP-binding protein [Anaerovirgula multivorans]SNS22304.1 DNA replication protein DnaC [Anaerovirgula multivorans]
MRYSKCNDCVFSHRCDMKGKEGIIQEERGRLFQCAICHKYNAVNECYNGMNIPPIYKEASIANIYKERLKDLFNELFTPPTKIFDERLNIILHGTMMGAGKTYAGCAMLNEFLYFIIEHINLLALKKDKEISELDPIYFIRFRDLSEQARNFRFDYETKEMLRKAKESWLVLLDDVEVTPDDIHSINLLSDIIESRYNIGKPTIITTSMDDIIDIEAMFTAKAWSRLNNNIKIMRLTK